ncbi:hypothetical protein GCM10010341_02320 [Streptomyces noursei]|nr:hypothetical protein GCM10010341_02320 [Streptomyces noursei]
MPAVPRLGDLQLEVAGQCVGENLTGAGTGGGCCGIDHEKCAHMQQRTYLPVLLSLLSGVRAGPIRRGPDATLQR